jgi:hypothetical protein
LLGNVNFSVENLRRFLQTHPANTDWDEPDYLAANATYYRF